MRLRFTKGVDGRFKRYFPRKKMPDYMYVGILDDKPFVLTKYKTVALDRIRSEADRLAAVGCDEVNVCYASHNNMSSVVMQRLRNTLVAYDKVLYRLNVYRLEIDGGQYDMDSAECDAECDAE